MKNENDKKILGCRGSLHVLSVGVALALGTQCASAAVEFHPRSEVSATWTDNLSLSRDDDPAKESGYVVQINPGFSLVQTGRRFSGSLEYTMQNVFFPGDRDRDSRFHQGEAAFTTELLSTWLYLDGAASYAQELLDPRLPTNNNNLFQVANQTDALTARVSPSLRHEFDSFRMDFRYTRGLIDYKRTEDASGVTQLQDADTQSYSGLFGSADEDARLTWVTRYERQEAEYENSPKFRYDTANAELGLLLGSSFRVIGRGGAESDPVQDQTKGGLDNETWEGGFRWTPSERTRVEAFYGDRFYGESYSALIHHEARRAEWDLTYVEGPMTQAQESILRPVEIDPAARGQGDIGAVDFTRQSNAVFLRKTTEARVHIAGQRTNIDVTATDYRRKYLTGTFGEEHTRGGSVGILRRLSASTDFGVNGRFEKTDLREGDNFRELNFGLELRHRIGERIVASAEATRIDRTGAADFTANLITLAISGEF